MGNVLGGAYMAMGCREMGADAYFALEQAKIGVMGAELAADILHLEKESLASYRAMHLRRGGPKERLSRCGPIRGGTAPKIRGGTEVIIRAPLPGKILRLYFESGEEVKKGDVLCILDSMKMQISIPAPTEGMLQWKVGEGTVVVRGEIITAINHP